MLKRLFLVTLVAAVLLAVDSKKSEADDVPLDAVRLG